MKKNVASNKDYSRIGKTGKKKKIVSIRLCKKAMIIIKRLTSDMEGQNKGITTKTASYH